jgi:hypothetical protein
MRAGHTHHVAKGREDYIWLSRDRQAIVNASHRQHAYRTTRPMNQIDVFGQHIFQPKAINCVRVAAANFHQSIVPLRVSQPADFF